MMVGSGNGGAKHAAFQDRCTTEIEGEIAFLKFPVLHGSGMLPGHIAGHYTKEECHIDLGRLSGWAGVRMVHAEAIGIDSERKMVGITHSDCYVGCNGGDYSSHHGVMMMGMVQGCGWVQKRF